MAVQILKALGAKSIFCTLTSVIKLSETIEIFPLRIPSETLIVQNTFAKLGLNPSVNT